MLALAAMPPLPLAPFVLLPARGAGATVRLTLLLVTGSPPTAQALDFRPRSWSFNFGLIVSPLERLHVTAVHKTPFTADMGLDKLRRDSWGTIGQP
jgi:hypothetical protein